MNRLLKLRYSPEDGVIVKYEKVSGDDGPAETITLESAERPRQALKDALKVMAEHLCTIAELPSTWAEKTEIRGATLTWTQDIRGVVITGLRTLKGSNAPLVLNSPHSTESPYNEGEDDIGVYNGDCGEALDELESQAMAYVSGDREQLQLSLTEEPSAVLHAAN